MMYFLSESCSVDVDDANCVLASDTSVKCFGSPGSDEGKVCQCKTGYAVDYNENAKRVCVEFCFSEVVDHHHFDTAAEIYSDEDKCTCTAETNITTCECLAGYVFFNGICTGEHPWIIRHCIRMISKIGKCRKLVDQNEIY